MISPLVSAMADSALLLPASALLFLYLAVLREWRLALAFALCLAAAGGATVALKLVFHACGHAIANARVVSPSGHVAFATFFYGALALLLTADRPLLLRRLAQIGVLLLALAVAISRVRLGAHTRSEVVIGFMVGGGALALFAVLHARLGKPAISWIPIAAGFAVAVILLGGDHFSLEHRIAATARKLSSTLDICEAPAGWRGGGIFPGLSDPS
ncbi:phosphatase PAP2 family protein [Enterovirga rhinocerotis]|uniref:PAP2 superfamily protein n=1 Tax=Enterovirga rhinocerotis TaxID=1339210 RepID=A0A4R7BW20_9HYPH|nr:phosphatase PAP2 family protein [Enterovirga rhinocerotis]TDR89302.1 PAP2 superfamily protein [Enterovirga rhinocerotis]